MRDVSLSINNRVMGVALWAFVCCVGCRDRAGGGAKVGVGHTDGSGNPVHVVGHVRVTNTKPAESLNDLKIEEGSDRIRQRGGPIRVSGTFVPPNKKVAPPVICEIRRFNPDGKPVVVNSNSNQTQMKNGTVHYELTLKSPEMIGVYEVVVLEAGGRFVGRHKIEVE